MQVCFIIKNMKAVQVKNLQKKFIKKKWWVPRYEPVITKAVDKISFEISKGEILGLLGPNGAGKTTTAQMLLGVLTPTSGDIYYFGKNFKKNQSELLKKMNFSSAYIELPHRLTVWENLDVYARLYEVKDKNKRIKKFLQEFQVLEYKNKQITQLSAGQKTRVLLAKAFLNYPQLLILDEPTASLDPDISVKVKKFLVRQQKKYGVSILFTSHNMHEVQEICDRVVFLNKGKIIEQDTTENLIKKLKKATIKMFISRGKDFLEQYLQNQGIDFQWKDKKIIFKIKENTIPKFLYKISDAGVEYWEIEILRPNLEDFFLEVVK